MALSLNQNDPVIFKFNYDDTKYFHWMTIIGNVCLFIEKKYKYNFFNRWLQFNSL